MGELSGPSLGGWITHYKCFKVQFARCSSVVGASQFIVSGNVSERDRICPIKRGGAKGGEKGGEKERKRGGAKGEEKGRGKGEEKGRTKGEGQKERKRERVWLW